MDRTVDYLASFYPPLGLRRPLPALLGPLAQSLTIVPWLFPTNTGRMITTVPLLLGITLSRPYFTAGSPLDDYNSASQFFCNIAVVLDFLVLRPTTEGAPRWIGKSKVLAIDGQASETDVGDAEAEGVSIDDKRLSLWERFKLGLRLSLYGRGVGWDWQVKNVPACTDAQLEKWAYVRRRLLLAIPPLVKKSLVVYLLGATMVLKSRTETKLQQRLLDVAVGWLSAANTWQSMNMLTNIGAAVTVAAGVFEQWEWPPFFGPLKEMWSVRQAWGVVWHQLMRRSFSQPALRLARLLGIKKGSLVSKYFQLYVSFAISTVFHEWDIFIAARRDVGELRFFMLQPLIITMEDFARWCWRKYTGRSEDDQLTAFERAFGWAWTFCWFSYCIPPYANGLLDAEITAYDSQGLLKLGQRHTMELLEGKISLVST